ncbi:hypothetical protein ACP4OV_003016 [Aristida adscensionis]
MEGGMAPAPAPAAAAAAGEKPHAVCLPYPVQGDITPTLQLAKLLHARGFHVTFVNTEYNHRRLLRARGPRALDGAPGFAFASIPDGLGDGDEVGDVTQDIAAISASTSSACLPHLLALLARLNAPDSGAPPVTCLVADGFMSFAYDAAKLIGVPCAALWTFSAAAFLGCRLYRRLIHRGLVPLRDEAQLTDGYLDTVLEPEEDDDGVLRGMGAGVQLRDLPSFMRTTDGDDVCLNFFMREAERLSLPDAVVFNTFDDLERPALAAARGVLPPAYAVGPLGLHARSAVPALGGVRSNLWPEQGDVLEWLDGAARRRAPPRSVVYVNFGSIAVMTREQLLEFAWGLAGCGHTFLWNVRPDIVRGGGAAALPPEFLAAVERSGSKLSTWCPQEAVLEHEAVGLFVTHSGWNSTLESVAAGVPMLCWPFFADQQTNCRCVRTEWRNGAEIAGEVRREDLAAMIREAMAGEKGREMRRRAGEWKEKALQATLPGGSAVASLDGLIDDVLLRKNVKTTAVVTSPS